MLLRPQHVRDGTASSCRRAARGARPSIGISATGFTLVEVLIALALVALAYTIAMPAIGRGRISAAVHNAKYVVVSNLSLARATAMRFGRPAVVRFDSYRERIWIEVDTTVAGSGVVDSLGYFDLAHDLQVNLESNRSSLCFDGRGVGTTTANCPEAGAIIVVSLAGKADTVLVSATGRVVSR